MTSDLTPAGTIDSLTDEQRIAAATARRCVFIEAGPGTGKTTVSAQRYGVLRFAAAHRRDARAVTAVSFTRAATYHLRQRVQRLWGPAALTWPHRIVTLDTIMCDLLHDLLRARLVVWPNSAALWPDGNVALDVRDSWASCGGTVSTRSIYRLSLTSRSVTLQQEFASNWASRVPAPAVVPLLQRGICTHQDVRDVLELALRDTVSAARVQARLGATMRAFIVDEVFDANDLDIAIIEAAIRAGVGVTLVGDPWQALYVFRGARPKAVPELLERVRVDTLPLTRSFRWRSPGQRDLAAKLRSNVGIVLPATQDVEVDVVLGLWWKELWGINDRVLPLAFHAFKGGYEEAAATLLLHHVIRTVFDLDATYLRDALTALNVEDPDAPRTLEPALQLVVDTLRPGGPAAVRAAYQLLVEAVGTVSRRTLRAPHQAHTGRLALLQPRLASVGKLVPGLTTHQAKGGEWGVVGVRLRDAERAALAGGLKVSEDLHRRIYVACTRAQSRTVELFPAVPQ